MTSYLCSRAPRLRLSRIISLVKAKFFSKSNAFMYRFSINRADLDSLMNFLLIVCTFFTAQDRIFKHVKRLPMGSGISPTLTRMVMDRIIHELLDRVRGVSFIKGFVDDTIAAIDADSIDHALHVLNFHRARLGSQKRKSLRPRRLSF